MAEKERQSSEDKVGKSSSDQLEERTEKPKHSLPIKTDSAHQTVNESSSSEEESYSHNMERTPESSVNGRGRHTSTSSTSGSDEEHGRKSTTDDKRRRTAHASAKGFIIPGLAASPPRFVSLEEIMKAANGVTNMALAHEIAVDNNFQLERVAPPENSLEHKVKSIVHQAFWDVLQESLNEDPPSYGHAIVLLSELKEGLLSILLPHHTKLKSEIDEVLDVELIRQQVDNGTLDFQYYAQYVISVMAKLCAPVRDEEIRELMRVTEVVPVFKGIFKMLDTMKLDMANFTIQQMRPHIQQHSVEYEKQKFAEFLGTLPDGLEFTRAWLQRTVDGLGPSSDLAPPSSSPAAGPSAVSAETAEKKNRVNSIIAKAYLAVVEWDDDWVFPETLAMDHGRFCDLRERVNHTALVAAMLLVTYNNVGQAIASLAKFKQELKEHIALILKDADPANLMDAVGSVALQVLKEVNDGLKEHGYPVLSEQNEKMLKGQIEELAKSDSRVRILVKQRILEFMHQVLTSSTASPIRVPPGLSVMQPELARITGTFLRLVSHNRAVFGDYYVDLINGIKAEKKLNMSSGSSSSEAGPSQQTAV